MEKEEARVLILIKQEEVYKILRNEFNYRPSLNLTQFFNPGFAERKLILVCDLIKLCKRKHNEISKQKADAKRKTVYVLLYHISHSLLPLKLHYLRAEE